MDERESNEDRIVAYVKLPSLQVMAACSASQALLLHFFSHTTLKYTRNKSFHRVSGYYARKQIDSLKLPSSIEKILITWLDVVNSQTMYWETNFNRLLSKNLENLRITSFHPECYILNPRGLIDYKKTAIEMVSNAGLSEPQKFAIMCIYCLEDQIATVDPNSLPENIVEGLDPVKDCLIYYWICRLKNELNKIPLNDFNSVDAAMTVMAARVALWHWEAFKYFWYRLIEADQISVAKYLFTSRTRHTRFYHVHQNDLFLMVSRDQQVSLLHEIPDKILKNFIMHDSLYFPWAAYWIWEECKDVMTGEQFAQMMKEVFQEVHGYEEKMKVMVELWQTAPDRLRNNAKVTLRDAIVHRLAVEADDLDFSYFMKCTVLPSKLCPTFVKFLRVFFSSAESTDYWRRIMLENSRIVLLNDIRLLSELIDLYFPNAEDLAELKSSVAYSNHMGLYSFLMLKHFAIAELRFKLNYFLPDINTRQNFQKELLQKFTIEVEEGVWIWIDGFNVSSWNELNIFISEAYADDEALALKNKKHFGSLLTFKINNHRSIFEKWDEFIAIALSIFVDEDLVTFKRNFLESVRYKFVNYSEGFTHFDEICYQTLFLKVVPWCLDNDEEAVLRYKNEHLSIDVIFDAMVNRFRNRLEKGKRITETVSSQLNDRLKWHLGDEEETKKYKLKRIDRFNDLFIFVENLKKEHTLKRSQGEDISATSEAEFKKKVWYRKCLLNVVLNWFFSDDETAIGEFISENPKFSSVFNFAGEEEHAT